VSGRYTLEALKTLRDAREQAARLELAAKVRDLDARIAEAQAELSALERRRAERRGAREQTGAALAENGVTAADLVWSVEHDRAQALRETEQRARLDAAVVRERAADGERTRAVSALGQAHAETEAVERHHARWQGERARKAEEAEDEAALERFGGRCHGPGQR
jgi:hypothetical protein